MRPLPSTAQWGTGIGPSVRPAGRTAALACPRSRYLHRRLGKRQGPGLAPSAPLWTAPPVWSWRVSRICPRPQGRTAGSLGLLGGSTGSRAVPPGLSWSARCRRRICPRPQRAAAGGWRTHPGSRGRSAGNNTSLLRDFAGRLALPLGWGAEFRRGICPGPQWTAATGGLGLLRGLGGVTAPSKTGRGGR